MYGPQIKSSSPFYVEPGEKGDGLYVNPHDTVTNRFLKEVGQQDYGPAHKAVKVYGEDGDMMKDLQVRYDRGSAFGYKGNPIPDRMKDRDKEQKQLYFLEKTRKN